jgi:hypothetical protein
MPSVVYAAVHAFENSVRALVTKAMAEKYGAAWVEKAPEREIQDEITPRHQTLLGGSGDRSFGGLFRQDDVKKSISLILRGFLTSC